MPVALVLGGGISGLSTAYYLRKFASSRFSKVILLEKSKRFGGWIQSSQYDNDVIHELGPRSIRSTGEAARNTLRLLEDLNLEPEVLSVTNTAAAATNRYIVYKDKLIPLPLRLNALFVTKLPFEKPLIRHGLHDLFTSRKKVEDESLHDFISRRLGEDIANYAIDPVCRGIVAGSSKHISIRSLFPLLYEAEQKHGSLLKGLRKIAKANALKLKDEGSSKLCSKAQSEGWSMWNLKKGLQQLPQTLVEYLQNDENVEILSDQNCQSLTFHGDHFQVNHGIEGSHKADHVVSCIPSFNLSPMIDTLSPSLSSTLMNIPFVNVAVVNLEFSGKVLPFQAFGYLVPSSETCRVLGVVFDSCNFSVHDGSDGAQRTRLTCMMGGHWFEEYFGNANEVEESHILYIALKEVYERLGIDQEPINYNVSIQKKCIPQYMVGHHKIVTSIQDQLKSLNVPLSLTGFSYEGVSVNDVISNARKTVEKLL